MPRRIASRGPLPGAVAEVDARVGAARLDLRRAAEVVLGLDDAALLEQRAGQAVVLHEVVPRHLDRARVQGHRVAPVPT
jgi:hypothetical protein